MEGGSKWWYVGYESAPGSARQDRARPAQGSPRLARPPKARSDIKLARHTQANHAAAHGLQVWHMPFN